jgi:hypothetical protein
MSLTEEQLAVLEAASLINGEYNHYPQTPIVLRKDQVAALCAEVRRLWGTPIGGKARFRDTLYACPPDEPNRELSRTSLDEVTGAFLAGLPFPNRAIVRLLEVILKRLDALEKRT